MSASLTAAVYRRRMARAMSEDELLAAITETATYAGWRWHHVRRSDKALQQGHSGFPDLVLAKAGRVLFLELKREGAQPRPDQLAWAAAINGDRNVVIFAADTESRTVTPADLEQLLTELAHG